MSRGGASYYYLRDGLGSVAALTDANAALVKEYKYGVFGNVVAEPGIVENSFLYTGREWEKELGVYYYRARFYDPRTGRFMQEDPIGYLGGNNFYLYTHNNPVNLIDPSGLFDGVTSRTLVA